MASPRIFRGASISPILYGRFRAFFAWANSPMQIFVAIQGLCVLRLYMAQQLPKGGNIAAGLPAAAARVG